MEQGSGRISRCARTAPAHDVFPTIPPPVPVARRPERSASQTAGGVEYLQRGAGGGGVSGHPDRQPQRQPILRRQHRPRRGQSEPRSPRGQRKLRRSRFSQTAHAPACGRPRRWSRDTPRCRTIPATTCKSSAWTFSRTCLSPRSPSAAQDPAQWANLDPEKWLGDPHAVAITDEFAASARLEGGRHAPTPDQRPRAGR